MPLRRHPTSSVNVPAASRLLDHPRTVYLREADLPPHLDGWLTVLFDPANLDATLGALIAASQDTSGTAEALRREERSGHAGWILNTYRVAPPTTGQLRTSRRNDDRSNLEGRRPQARR